MRLIKVLAVLLVLFCVCTCSSDANKDNLRAEQEAQQLIQRYVNKIGGETALTRLQTRIIHGHRIDDRPYRGEPVESPFTVWADDNGYWRFESALESFGKDTMGGWRSDSTGVHTDLHQNRSKLGFVFDPGSHLNWDRYFLNRRSGSKMTMDYRQVVSVLTDRDTTYYTLWFDQETGLLNHIGLHWNLYDYRSVDGVMLPHMIVQGRKGGHIAYGFDSIRHNLMVPDSMLARPS